MPSELDILMDLDPVNLTKEDLATVVAYHRKKRAERSSGTGKKAEKEVGSVSLDSIVKSINTKLATEQPTSPKPASTSGFKRRV